MSTNPSFSVAAIERRNAERRTYPPTPMEVDWSVEGPFVARSAGITIDRSMDGFSMILVSDEPVKASQLIRVRPPDLPPLTASVKWQRRLDDRVIRIGCAFVGR